MVNKKVGSKKKCKREKLLLAGNIRDTSNGEIAQISINEKNGQITSFAPLIEGKEEPPLIFCVG